MPLTPPPIFEHVPSRTDNEDFDIRADEAWANLQLWLLFFVELVDLLNAALTAPIEALELTASPRLVGRTTAGAGPSEELTLAAVLALLQGDGSSSTAAGFRGIPVRTITGAASVIAGDNGGQLLHTDGSACSVTSSVSSLPTATLKTWRRLPAVSTTRYSISAAIISRPLRCISSALSAVFVSRWRRPARTMRSIKPMPRSTACNRCRTAHSI